MNIEMSKKVVKLVILAGQVPVLEGVRGIGKSDIVKTVAKELNAEYINIDSNLLKEGEIGGLPVPSKNEAGKQVLDYIPYSKLEKANRIAREGGIVLLFIDELNRATQETQAEMMNLILNKEINGLRIHENVKIVAALNPSQNSAMMNSEDFQDANYSTSDMDDACKNRLVWLSVEPAIESFLSWASASTKETKKDKNLDNYKWFNLKDYSTNIHMDIIQFLSENPDFLNRIELDSNASPSPRTWSFASNILRTYEANSDLFTEEELMEAMSGAIGIRAYTKFKSSAPLSAIELLSGNEKAWDRYIALQESVQKTVVDSCLTQLNMKLENIEDVQKTVFFNAIEVLGNDVIMSVLRALKTDYSDLYKDLSKFVDKETKTRRMVKIVQRIKKEAQGK